MNNFYFKDFTELNYTKLLKKALKHYIFCTYSNYNNFDRSIIWRHDIDFSVNRALSLSKIEKSLNIKSIYFIQLCSEFYNIFEINTLNMIHEIIANGHHIGLHFHAQKYFIKTKKDLEGRLSFEKEILENLFKTKINYFSFHNPDKNILKYTDFKYNNLINVYSLKIKDSFKYCSDSNGYWRHDRLENLIESNQYRNLHILTHPGWWQKEAMPPFDRILRCVDGRSNFIKNNYNNLLVQNSRKNVK